MSWREDLHPRAVDGRFGAATRSRRVVDVAARARVATATRPTRAAPLPDGVQMMPLARLRAQVKYGTDGFDYDTDTGWAQIMDRQLTNTTTPAFLADILRNGMQPLRVATSAYGGPLGDADEIRDGNHRLAAAMLLGLSEVPITRRDLADDTGANKVPVRMGRHVGPVPAGTAAVIAQAKALLNLPDPGHQALQDAELDRLTAAAEARDTALEAAELAEQARIAERRRRNALQYQAGRR